MGTSLENINLTVKPDQLVAVIGHVGAGKVFNNIINLLRINLQYPREHTREFVSLFVILTLTERKNKIFFNNIFDIFVFLLLVALIKFRSSDNYNRKKSFKMLLK